MLLSTPEGREGEGEFVVAPLLGNEPAHFRFAVKFHLPLGGVNIHVHGSRINFQKQTANRIAAFHQCGVVAL